VIPVVVVVVVVGLYTIAASRYKNCAPNSGCTKTWQLVRGKIIVRQTQ